MRGWVPWMSGSCIGCEEGGRPPPKGTDESLRRARCASRSRGASAGAPSPLPGRRVLRRRRREHVPDAPVVQAACRARPHVAGRRAEPRRDGGPGPRRGRRAPRRVRPHRARSRALHRGQDIRVVLYVNQNTRNFQMFRYGRRWHVFINHGESDKMYMTTNQYKAYDYAFIAGDAARERLARVLWDYDLDAPHDRDRASAGRSLLGSAAVHARRPHRRAVRADVGGRSPVGALRLDPHARRGARIRSARDGTPPGDLSSAPALRRRRSRVRRRQPADHRGDRCGQRG